MNYLDLDVYNKNHVTDEAGLGLSFFKKLNITVNACL